MFNNQLKRLNLKVTNDILNGKYTEHKKYVSDRPKYKIKYKKIGFLIKFDILYFRWSFVNVQYKFLIVLVPL